MEQRVQFMMEMSKKFRGKVMEIDLYGEKIKAELRPSVYEKRKRLALTFRNSFSGEPMGHLTVNLPDHELGDREVFIKNWSENEPLAKAALASGLFRDTGRRVPSGHVMVPVWEIL